jgi:hypothetical protein
MKFDYVKGVIKKGKNDSRGINVGVSRERSTYHLGAERGGEGAICFSD